jgi:hypothetical protein
MVRRYDAVVWSAAVVLYHAVLIGEQDDGRRLVTGRPSGEARAAASVVDSIADRP